MFTSILDIEFDKQTDFSKFLLDTLPGLVRRILIFSGGFKESYRHLNSVSTF